MKRIAMTLALLSGALFTFTAMAQPPGKGKRGGAQAEKGGLGGAGQARGQRGGPGGQRGGPGGGDPAQMVAKMMSEFDKDGDQKLDVTELTALFTAMRERRGQAGQGRPGTGQGQQGRRPGGAGGQRPGGGQRPDGAGKGRPDGAGKGGPGGKGGGKGRRGQQEAEEIGGAKPKRPTAE